MVFNVGVTSTAPVGYQWQLGGSDMVGATDTSLTLTNVQVADEGNYWVVITNRYGALTSDIASLTLPSPIVPFNGVALAPGGVALTWASTPGFRYRVQYKPDLAAPFWTYLGGALLATGPLSGVSDAVEPDRQRFYRVLLAQ